MIFGPNNKKFREAQHLLEQKGGFEVTGEGLQCQWTPDASAIRICGQFGKEFAAYLQKNK